MPGRAGLLGAGGLCLRRFRLGCSRYGGEEEGGAEAEDRARVLLERLRQQAKARQLKKQQEAQPEGGEGELSGGAGPGGAGLSPGGEPGEGKRKRKRESEERGQKKLKKRQQPPSSSEERADTEEAAGGSTPSKKKEKENRRKSKVPQEGTEAGSDKLRSFWSTVLNREVDAGCPLSTLPNLPDGKFCFPLLNMFPE